MASLAEERNSALAWKMVAEDIKNARVICTTCVGAGTEDLDVNV
jgi:hypothetical protein